VAALILPKQALKGSDWAESLGTVVRLRRFWILVLVSVSINVCWHFLVHWLPTYLKEDRAPAGLVGLMRRSLAALHIDGDPKYLASGLLTVVPFLMGDVGNLGGGALSRRFARRGMTPDRALITVMGLCTLLISCGALVGWIRSDTIMIVLLGLI
jgi:MFS transporter, ACS family, hexuronate transporter